VPQAKGAMARRVKSTIALAAGLAALAAPLAAKDSLGVFGQWGAFRDPSVPRCYAIAKPSAAARGGIYAPFVSVGTWPKLKVRGQLHVRLSRKVSPAGTISLRVGGRSFELTGGGGDAWTADKRIDAAVIAAMRSAATLSVTGRDTSGRSFTDSYALEGAATAMDAATVGCARIR
jgi:hypothetical protein